MASLMPEGKQSFTDATGAPLVGGKLWTYDAGTNTPRVTYADADATTPNTNPLILDARGEATIFWSGVYKVVLKDANDNTIWTVDDVVDAQSLDLALVADLASSSANKGADLIGFSHATTYGAGTVGNALQFAINVKNAPYNAVGDGVADDSSAIQSAINSGRSLIFPDGDYSVANLTQSTNEQKFFSLGRARLIRRAGATPVLTASGRAIVFSHLTFRGDGAGSGDAVVCTGDNPVFDHCSIWTSTGFALRSEGNGTRIIGTDDIYYSADATAAAICIGKIGTPTLYAQISGIATSTSPVGVKYRDHGASGISDCQLGKVDMSQGAAYITNCRIVGDYIAQKSFNTINNSTISGNVTLGDGVTSLSGFGFGPNVFVQSGSTVLINTNIRDSVLHISQVEVSGVTVTDNLTGTATDIGNAIYTGERSYTPVWTAASVNPTLNDGTLTGRYTRSGRTVCDTFSLSVGAATATGTGEYSFALSHIPKGSAKYCGSAVILDAGSVLYIANMRTRSDGTKRANGFTNNAGTGLQQNSPMVWASGDTLDATVTYSVV